MINIFLINTEKVQQKDASSISKNYRQKTFENYPYVRGVWIETAVAILWKSL